MISATSKSNASARHSQSSTSSETNFHPSNCEGHQQDVIYNNKHKHPTIYSTIFTYLLKNVISKLMNLGNGGGEGEPDTNIGGHTTMPEYSKGEIKIHIENSDSGPPPSMIEKKMIEEETYHREIPPSPIRTICIGCLKFTIVFAFGAVCGVGAYKLYSMFQTPPIEKPENACERFLYRGMFQTFAELSTDEQKLGDFTFNTETSDFLSTKKTFNFEGIDATLYYNSGPDGDTEFVQYTEYKDVSPDQLIDTFKLIELRNKWRDPDVERIVLKEGGNIINPQNTKGAKTEQTKIYPGTIENPKYYTYTSKIPGGKQSYVEATAMYKFNYKQEVIYMTCARGLGGMSGTFHPETKTPGTTRIYLSDFCQVIKSNGKEGSHVFFYYWEQTSIPGFIMGTIVDKMAAGLKDVRRVAKEHKIQHVSLFENVEIDLESAEWSDEEPKIAYEKCLSAVPSGPEPKHWWKNLVEGVNNATGLQPTKSNPVSTSDEGLETENLPTLGEKFDKLFEIEDTEFIELNNMEVEEGNTSGEEIDEN